MIRLDDLGMPALPLRFLTPFPRPFSRRCGTPQRLGYGIRQPARFPQRPFGGRKLRFPPSNVRSALCLLFSDYVLRPRGPSPLEPPLLCCRKSANSPQSRNRARSVVHGLPHPHPSPLSKKVRLPLKNVSGRLNLRGRFSIPKSSITYIEMSLASVDKTRIAGPIYHFQIIL
jgi:hypothetical protein